VVRVDEQPGRRWPHHGESQTRQTGAAAEVEQQSIRCFADCLGEPECVVQVRLDRARSNESLLLSSAEQCEQRRDAAQVSRRRQGR
jgi:hypothetical protein